MDTELLRAILFPARTYDELAERILDRDWVLWPGCMRKTISQATLETFSDKLKTAIVKLLPSRSFIQQPGGDWTLTAAHWKNCRIFEGLECTCWRKQYGYWPEELP